MPPDEPTTLAGVTVERRREVEAWMDRARLDLRAARVDIDADPPLLADAAFHCQQAVEKALKALLTRHDHAFAKTHTISARSRGPAWSTSLRSSRSFEGRPR
jgi:hypothetical protein